jgi:hypothetical protein
VERADVRLLVAGRFTVRAAARLEPFEDLTAAFPTVFLIGLRALSVAFPAFFVGVPTLPFKRLKIAAPSSAGERTVVTRAASSAANLSAAVPLPPEITAPA